MRLLRSRARPACPGRAAASLSAPGIASLRGVSRRQGRAVPRAGRRAEMCRAVFRPSGAVWGRVFCRRKGGPGSGKERSVRGDVSRLFRALFSPPPAHVFPPFPFREGGFFCTRKGEAAVFPLVECRQYSFFFPEGRIRKKAFLHADFAAFGARFFPRERGEEGGFSSRELGGSVDKKRDVFFNDLY